MTGLACVTILELYLLSCSKSGHYLVLKQLQDISTVQQYSQGLVLKIVLDHTPTQQSSVLAGGNVVLKF